MKLQYKDALGNDIKIGGIYGKSDYRQGIFHASIIHVLKKSINQKGEPQLIVLSRTDSNKNGVETRIKRINQLWPINKI